MRKEHGQTLPSTPTNRVRQRRRSQSQETFSDISKLNGSHLLDDQTKYRAMWIRTYSSLWMLGGVILILYLGHLFICAMVVIVQIFMAAELFHLRRRVHEDKRLPGFWLVNWYFFFTAMLYVYGRILSQQLVNTVTPDKFFHRLVNGLVKYQMVICYFLYIADPLYVNSSDTLGLNLINEQLVGTENYGIWSRAMQIALRARNKLAFVDGSCRKPDPGSDKVPQWERCNAIVLSWIMNAVSKEIFGGIVYSTDAAVVWNDLRERFDKVNGSRIFALHREIGSHVQGMMWFILTLKKKMYKYQFGQYAWTHMILIVVFTQSSFTVANIFEGIFWFVLPASLIAINDVAAYFFGFFFGRTPLIKLSPKKTWEGFIGASIATVISAFLLANILGSFPWMTCPRKGLSTGWLDCDPGQLFKSVYYSFPLWLPQWFPWKGISVMPVQWHALCLGLFASIIAPFGGFFASGLKRALKIKDFGDSIPGHGGFTDRMDCQMVISIFAYIYFQSFIDTQVNSVDMILDQITRNLSFEEQERLYYMLGQLFKEELSGKS